MSDPVEYRVARLHEALTHDPRVQEQSLEVRIEGERIIIRGELVTPERCEAAVAIAEEMFPDATIVADLKIVPERPVGGEPERL